MGQISNNIGGSPKPNDPWLEVGKKLKKTWDDLNNCAHNKDYKGVVKNIVKLGVIAFVVASAIFESLGKEGKKAFLDEFKKIIGNFICYLKKFFIFSIISNYIISP